MVFGIHGFLHKGFFQLMDALLTLYEKIVVYFLNLEALNIVEPLLMKSAQSVRAGLGTDVTDGPFGRHNLPHVFIFICFL